MYGRIADYAYSGVGSTTSDLGFRQHAFFPEDGGRQ